MQIKLLSVHPNIQRGYRWVAVSAISAPKYPKGVPLDGCLCYQCTQISKGVPLGGCLCYQVSQRRGTVGWLSVQINCYQCTQISKGGTVGWLSLLSVHPNIEGGTVGWLSLLSVHPNIEGGTVGWLSLLLTCHQVVFSFGQSEGKCL